MVLFKRAAAPTPVLSTPSVLNKSAAAPNAVFSSAVLKRSVPAPVAVLQLPATVPQSENQPTAVFAEPVVRFLRALLPSAVLNPASPPSGGGLTACAVGSIAARKKSMSTVRIDRLEVVIDRTLCVCG